MLSTLLKSQIRYKTTNHVFHTWKINNNNCSLFCNGLSWPMRTLSTNNYWLCNVCTRPPHCRSEGGKPTVTYKPYIVKGKEDHDHKNMKLKRPMSPHLTIYAPTMPAMTSIVQRITGTALVFYTLLLAGGTMFLPNGIESYVSFIQSLDLSRLSVFFIKLVVGFPFTFHWINGARFCMWNAGKWLSMKKVYDTGYKGIYASIVLAFLCALL